MSNIFDYRPANNPPYLKIDFKPGSDPISQDIREIQAGSVRIVGSVKRNLYAR